MPVNYNYLSQLQKYKIALSSLFKNTTIVRYDDLGAISKQILVPIIGNSSNTKYYDYANSNVINTALVPGDIETNILLPQMVISIVSLKPDEALRLEETYICDSTTGTLLGSPHILEFTLSILTRRISDSEQIFEQTISSFLGDKKSLTVNLSTDPEIKVPLIVKYNDLDLGYEDAENRTLAEIGLYESTFYFSVEGIRIYDLPIGDVTGVYTYDFEIQSKLDSISDVILSTLNQ